MTRPRDYGPEEWEIDLTPPPPRSRAWVAAWLIACVLAALTFSAIIGPRIAAERVDPAALVDAACQGGC